MFSSKRSKRAWSDFNRSICLEIKSCLSSIWNRFNNSIFRSNSSLTWSKVNSILSSKFLNLSFENSSESFENSSNNCFISLSIKRSSKSWIFFCLSINKLSWTVKLRFKSDFFWLFSFTASNNRSNCSFFRTTSFDNCCFSQSSVVLSNNFSRKSWIPVTISPAIFSAFFRSLLTDWLTSRL